MTSELAPVGILVNPYSGRDVRRMQGHASTSTHDVKRGEVKRAVIGAVAAGAKRVLLFRDPFRITTNAVGTLKLDAEIEVLDSVLSGRAEDTERATESLREEGCGALIVLGGDGTSRRVARVWRDAPIVPISTGTNNVFPLRVEATCAGAAAGLVASRRILLAEVSRHAKTVSVEIESEDGDLALIDAALLVEDRVGNHMTVDPHRLRALVLSRSEPAAVGMSGLGGLVHSCGADVDEGVEVICAADGPREQTLRAPVSPGLYREVYIESHRALALGERVEVRGPGVLAFDGDRERALGEGQRAWLSVDRDGPRVIDVDRALELASERGQFVGMDHWHDHDASGDLGCC